MSFSGSKAQYGPHGKAVSEGRVMTVPARPPVHRPTRKLMIARFPGSNWEHSDLTDWYADLRVWLSQQEWLDLVCWKILSTPVSMCRNRAVREAIERRCDFLLMVDDDMKPDVDPAAPKFVPTAIDFMLKHDGPSIVLAPYCGAPPDERVMVFREGFHGSGPNARPQIADFEREEAAAKKGFEQVLSGGTGLCLVDLRAVERLMLYEDKGFRPGGKKGERQPFFQYEWKNGDNRQDEWVSTEDVPFFRDMSFAGVPVYVAWDCWAGHWKPTLVGKPEVPAPHQFPERLLALARTSLRRSEPPAFDGPSIRTQGPDGAVADGIPGWFDYADLYDEVVAAAPPGAMLVEVGVFCGKSLAHLGAAAKKADKGLRVVGVDTFQGSPEHAGLMAAVPTGGMIRDAFLHLRDAGLLDDVTLVKADSVTAADLLGDPWFVFLDADHSEDRVLADLTAWGPKVDRARGVIAGHDYNDFPGVRSAVDKYFGADCPAVTVRGSYWVYSDRADVSQPFDRNGAFLENVLEVK